jgi:hypothetical protein
VHTRCDDGLEALRQYHYAYDEDTKAFGLNPEHDWSSHTADAWRYLACVVKYSELVTRPKKPAQEPDLKTIKVDKDGKLILDIPLERLFKDNEKSQKRRRV